MDTASHESSVARLGQGFEKWAYKGPPSPRPPGRRLSLVPFLHQTVTHGSSVVLGTLPETPLAAPYLPVGRRVGLSRGPG